MKICSEIDDPRGDLGHHNAIKMIGGIDPFLKNCLIPTGNPVAPSPLEKNNIRREQWQ